MVWSTDTRTSTGLERRSRGWEHLGQECHSGGGWWQCNSSADLLDSNRPIRATIEADCAVVAHDKVFGWAENEHRQFLVRVGAGISFEVRLPDEPSVDEHLTVPEADRFAGQSHHSLERAVSVPVIENNHLSALEFLGRRARQGIVVRVEIRKHAFSLYHHDASGHTPGDPHPREKKRSRQNQLEAFVTARSRDSVHEFLFVQRSF